LDAFDPKTGARRRRWHSFRGTKREAQIECARLVSARADGTDIDPVRLTLGDFLERWLDHMKGQVSPRSHERYAELARKNIVPLLGRVSLSKLKPADISGAYAKALSSGRLRGQGGLWCCARLYSKPCSGKCWRATPPIWSNRHGSSANRCAPSMPTERST
jgi:hypothetical protein